MTKSKYKTKNEVPVDNYPSSPPPKAWSTTARSLPQNLLAWDGATRLYFCASIDLFRSASDGSDLLSEFIFLHFPKLEFGYDEIFGFSLSLYFWACCEKAGEFLFNSSFKFFCFICLVWFFFFFP